MNVSYIKKYGISVLLGVILLAIGGFVVKDSVIGFFNSHWGSPSLSEVKTLNEEGKWSYVGVADTPYFGDRSHVYKRTNGGLDEFYILASSFKKGDGFVHYRPIPNVMTAEERGDFNTFACSQVTNYGFDGCSPEKLFEVENHIHKKVAFSFVSGVAAQKGSKQEQQFSGSTDDFVFFSERQTNLWIP